MAKYYYLAASLSYLKFREEPPISRDGFIAECRKWLSAGDITTLLSADLYNHDIKPVDTRLVKEWKSFDLALREDLAVIREARVKGESCKTPEILRTVIEQETPLLMEVELERIRWDFLEHKNAGRYFDTDALVLYFLKLQILERLAKFNKDAGERFFYEFCEVDYEKKVRQNSGY